MTVGVLRSRRAVTLAGAVARTGAAALDLPRVEVPQLGAVSARLTDLTGWSITPLT